MLEKIKALRLKDWLAIGGILVSFTTLFLLFGTGITSQYQGEYVKITPAYAFVFGGTFHRTYVVNNVVENSEGALYRVTATALVAWILLLLAFIGSIVALVFVYAKKKSWGKFVLAGCGVFLVVSAVLLFVSTDGAFQSVISDDPSTYTAEAMHEAIRQMNVKLGFGFIGTGVFAIISGLLFGASAALSLKKN